MARYSYDRLSAQDASFLFAEQDTLPMHVGAVALVEAGPLLLEDGGVDIDRFRKAVESVLHWIPRYRQKLAWTPIEGWPVWIDDLQFELAYHIRHIALPRPGRVEQLQELAARIHARPLDRQRPLWELWVVEGVAGGEQVALLNKIHHCMIDGAAGADLSQILMSPLARTEVAAPVPYMPRAAPSPGELLWDSIDRACTQPFSVLRDTLLGGERDDPSPGLAARLRSIREMAGFALKPVSPTPINGTVGPRRRIHWLTMPLDDVREVRGVLGCTVNDVVLAVVSGAMRRYLFRRRVDTRDLEFRVAAPVNMRREGDDTRQGNHVSSWVVRLPLAEEEPLAQVAFIQAQTARLKRSSAALAVETLMLAAEYLPPAVLSLGAGLASGPANLIVTNVPGPQFPLYMVGARLLAMYPLVPLLPHGGLGIALFSYEGKLCWGFNADEELLPDLTSLIDDVGAAFEDLRHATVAHYLAQRTGRERRQDPGEAEAAQEPRPPSNATDAVPPVRAVGAVGTVAAVGTAGGGRRASLNGVRHGSPRASPRAPPAGDAPGRGSFLPRRRSSANGIGSTRQAGRIGPASLPGPRRSEDSCPPNCFPGSS